MYASKSKEIDVYLWVETPEMQVIADEIVFKLESLGLTVNAIYPTYEDWVAIGNTNEADLMWGGLSWTFDIDNIFGLAFILQLINAHMLRHEDKYLQKLVDKIGTMMDDAGANPDLVTEAYIEEMIKTFHKIEKRLWKKKYLMPFVQWEGFHPWFGTIKFTEVFTVNCFKGRVFHSKHLRTSLFRSIDRSVFLDYYAAYTPFDVYPVYHLFQMSIYHDTSLPNY